MSLYWKLLACLALLFAPIDLLAQDEPLPARATRPGIRITLGGTAQPRLTYAWTNPSKDVSGDEQQRLGFGIRRARLRANAAVGSKATFTLQMDGTGASVQILDLYFGYRLSEHVVLNAGRLYGAVPRAAELTSHTEIDAVDRAVISDDWSRMTVGSGSRDFGLEARMAYPGWDIRAFLHNGDGSWSRERGNFRSSPTDPTDGVDRTGLAASLYATYTPEQVEGLEVGGFASVNTSRNPNTAFLVPVGENSFRPVGRRYTSYSGHLYWGARPGSQPIRLKADVIGISYEEINRSNLANDPYAQQVLGYALLGALRVHPAAELFGRYERMDTDLDASGAGDAIVTAGGSLSLSALQGRSYSQERLTLGWSARLPEASRAGLAQAIVLQAQIVF